MARSTTKLDPEGLTPLERGFVDNMLEDPTSMTEALRKAGSRAKNMRAAACQMMKRPKVRAALEKARAERARRTEITVDRVLYELWKRATANLLDYGEPQEDGTFLINLSDLTPEKAAAIEEISFEQIGTEVRDGQPVPVRKVKIKLTDSTRALQLVGNHLGMFPTKISGTLHHKHSFEEALEEVFADDAGGDDGAAPLDDPDA